MKAVKFLSLPLLLVSALFGGQDWQISKSSVHAKNGLKDVELFKSQHGFYAMKNGEKHKINNYDIDSQLHNLSKTKLKKFLKNGGYLTLNQMSNNDYTLKTHVRGLGGGPLFGWLVYGGVKSVAYGTIGGAMAGTVVATGGAAAVALGGSAIATAGTAMVGTGALLSTSALPLGAAIATAGPVIVAGGIATSATATTGAVLATGYGFAVSGLCMTTLMASIEATALAAAAAATACPFLP